MYLEDSNGRIQANPSPAAISQALEQIGTTLDHCILQLDGDEFVQAAGRPGRLFVQYGASGALQESDRTDLDVATVSRVFSDAMAGNDAWKAELGFRPAGGPAAQAESTDHPGARTSAAGTAGAAGTAAGSSLKDEIFGSVRRQAGREVSYGVGRMVRRFLRRLLGGRL
ncbi:MAG: hypothetical protein ACOC2D_14305 [Spirochaetota bacterium]